MSYRSYHSPTCGFSTVEQALVLPFIVMLVLGMIDVLRAKYTADEGVRGALVQPVYAPVLTSPNREQVSRLSRDPERVYVVAGYSCPGKLPLFSKSGALQRTSLRKGR